MQLDNLRNASSTPRDSCALFRENSATKVYCQVCASFSFCYCELLMSSSPSATTERHFFQVQSRVADTSEKRKLKSHPCSFRVLVGAQQSKGETRMASTNTLIKNLLNVKNTVVESAENYTGGRGVKHLRVKARPEAPVSLPLLWEEMPQGWPFFQGRSSMAWSRLWKCPR